MRQNVPVLGDFMYFVYISSANSFSALVIGERERKKRERKKEEKEKKKTLLWSCLEITNSHKMLNYYLLLKPVPQHWQVGLVY